MLKLVQFHPAFGVRNMSPFCLKLETWLRMSGIEHEVVWNSSTRDAPKGKLPYIEDGDLRLGDSSLIIDYLISQHGDRLDSQLDVRQHAQSLAWRTLFEEGLIYPILYSRWIDPAGWQLIQQLFDPLPPSKRQIIADSQRESVRQRLDGQGMGRHSAKEIYHLGGRYLTAIEAQLGDQPFMLGTQPSALDATAYGFLANLIDTPFDNPLNQQASATPRFVAYVMRMTERYFSEPAQAQ